MIDVRYWEQVKASGSATPPTDKPVASLIAELEAMLADDDGHVRDELGFEILGEWVLNGVCDDVLRELGDRMIGAMYQCLGETGTDSVFGRSFAALILGLAVERDNIASVLDEATVRRWCDNALVWFLAERDLRGITDPERGVAHTVAHGADVIASLARSRHIDTPRAEALQVAIVTRLAETSGVTLMLSEDERLAYAAMALLHRGDLDAGHLARALEPLKELAAVRHRTDLDPRAHARLNALNWLRALHLQLNLGVKPMPWYADDGHFARQSVARDTMLDVVTQVLQPFSFWYAELPRGQ